MGKDDRGVWRTARKRAYRPPLCELMADALLSGIGGPESLETGLTTDHAYAEMPDALRPFAQELPDDADEDADDDYADLDGAAAWRSEHRNAVLAARRRRELERAEASDAFVAAAMLDADDGGAAADAGGGGDAACEGDAPDEAGAAGGRGATGAPPEPAVFA